MKKNFIFCLLFFISTLPLTAQHTLTTVGLQIKPIFPNSYLGTGTQSVTQNGVTFDLGLNTGFSGGMIIRHAFSDLLAFETGINYVKRKYDLKITDGSFSDSDQFRIIGYEIPVSFLVYIRLGEKFFMNASLGTSIDMFASDVESYDEYYFQHSYRTGFFLPAVLANLGWEYRTEKSGYFYVGASYHRPFTFIFDTRIRYEANGKYEKVAMNILGNYLTVDLRYFFYEDSRKKYKTPDSED
jgi:hypothetical protein